MKINMRNTEPIMTKKQLEALLAKAARGTITQMASYAEKQLQYFVKRNLYDQDLVGTRNSYYHRSRYLYGSIQATRTESTGDSYYAESGFNQDYLREHAEPPKFRTTKKRGRKGGKLKLVEFGRYTDVFGNYVGDEMIEEGWLEDGTDRPSIVPRRGAHFLESTEDAIESFIRTNGIETQISKELGRVVIERFR